MTNVSDNLMTPVRSTTPVTSLRKTRPLQYGQDMAGMYVADLSHKMPNIARAGVARLATPV